MKDDGKIDKLLRESLRTEQPSTDFTNKIMGQIEAMDTNEEKALSSVLKRNALQSPSLNFTDRVMGEIEKSSIAIVNKPIIGKKAWAFIGICLTLIVAYVLLTPSKETATSLYLDNAMAKYDGMLSFDLPGILSSPLFAISVFALSSLLFLDYFLRNRSLSLKI